MESTLLNRMALGAAAGLGATVAMQGLRTANQRWLPGTMPPIREDPGAFMVDQAESALPVETRDRVPETAEETAATLLHFGYGGTAGLLYGAIRRDPDVIRDGILLGLGVWAVGYLGWLPRTGLMPPVTGQRTGQVVAPVVQHVFFGFVTAAAFAWLLRRVLRA